MCMYMYVYIYKMQKLFYMYTCKLHVYTLYMSGYRTGGVFYYVYT